MGRPLLQADQGRFTPFSPYVSERTRKDMQMCKTGIRGTTEAAG